MNRDDSHRRAFTLVELLVATGITIVIAGLMVGMTSHVLSLWSRTSGKLGAEAQARFALDQLALDLEAAIFRDDGAVWLAAAVLDQSDNSGLWESSPSQKPAGVASHSLDPASASLTEARFGQAGLWLRFFTTACGRNDLTMPATTLSAPVAVAYQIVRRSIPTGSSTSSPRYLFHRSQVRPGQAADRPGTLESGFNLDPALAVSNYVNAAGESNDGTEENDPLSIRCPHRNAVLAENVIDFGAHFYGRDPAGTLARIFPTDAGDLTHFAYFPGTDGDKAGRFPAIVDVMIRVLTEEGARQIALLEAQPNRLGPRPAHYRTDADWWWGIAEANSQVFARRVVLPGQSP